MEVVSDLSKKKNQPIAGQHSAGAPAQTGDYHHTRRAEAQRPLPLGRCFQTQETLPWVDGCQVAWRAWKDGDRNMTARHSEMIMENGIHK